MAKARKTSQRDALEADPHASAAPAAGGLLEPPAAGRGIRTVQVAGAPLEMVWAEPSSLAENPFNDWKIHTDFQSEVVAELIQKYGWVVPLTYNRTTGRLLNGHDRRKIAIAQGMPYVPVVVGDWPEAQEPDIIATLDPSGALARTDPEALSRVMAEMDDPSPIIARMMAGLAESEGILAELAKVRPPRIEPQFVSSPDGPGVAEQRQVGPSLHDSRPAPTPPVGSVSSPDPAGGPDPPLASAPASGVRMVNLFLSAEEFPEFQEMIDALGDRYGTETPTDTVVECLREAYHAGSVADPS